MVVETVISPKLVDKKPAYSLVLGFILASIGIVIGWLFPKMLALQE